MKIPAPVMEVLSRLKERGFEAYLVGGCVRDAVRGTSPKDFDVATSALPEEVQRSFPKTIPTGIEHGTVTVLSRGTPVEVTTFRTEGDYLDARRPSSVAFHTDIREDLSRRDFTINAMALDPTDGEGRLVDPFGGQADLEAKLIRCVGTPEERFSEDGLRPLRAVRFAAVLGFELHPATEAAIPATLPSFRKVAPERVREEFTRLLLSPRAAGGLELLRRTGLLEGFLPEVAALAPSVFGEVLVAVERSLPQLEVRLAVLLHLISAPDRARAVREILLRLRFPNRTVEASTALVREEALGIGGGTSDAQLRRLAARLGPPLVEPFFGLLAAIRGPSSEVAGLHRRASDLLAQNPPLDARALALDGHRIMQLLGVGPSRQVGEATRFLVDLVLEDPSQNTPERLQEALLLWAAAPRG